MLSKFCDGFSANLSCVLVAVFEASAQTLFSELQSELVDFDIQLFQVQVAFRHDLELDCEDLAYLIAPIVKEAHSHFVLLVRRHSILRDIDRNQEFAGRAFRKSR